MFLNSSSTNNKKNIKMKKTYFLFLFILTFNQFFVLSGQSLNLPFLFKTGYRINYLYLPEQIKNEVRYQMQQVQFQSMFSIKSKASLDLANFNFSKMDVGFRQTFLSINAGARFFDSNLTTNTKTFANISLGITHIRAGVRKGIWLYTGNIGTVQDIENTNEIRPFGIVGVANIQILGLKKQNIFGLAAAYTQAGRILPIPIIGLNRRLSSKWDLNLLLPVNIAFNYAWSNKKNLKFRINPQFFQVNLHNISPNFLPNPLQNNPITLQSSQLEINTIFQYKYHKNLKFVVQAGGVFANQLSLQQDKKVYQKFNFDIFPQFLVGFHFNLADGWIGPQMFMAD
ncbi:MAG: hypothetical protein EAZ20_02355 [Bacteroidetes bacterium]|nr:MAG: hypothetical protein EAZ20_02355 [Bacteroidota bacterium]